MSKQCRKYKVAVTGIWSFSLHAKLEWKSSKPYSALPCHFLWDANKFWKDLHFWTGFPSWERDSLDVRFYLRRSTVASLLPVSWVLCTPIQRAVICCSLLCVFSSDTEELPTNGTRKCTWLWAYVSTGSVRKKLYSLYNSWPTVLKSKFQISF